MFNKLKEAARDWLLQQDGDRELADISLEYSYQDLANATRNFDRSQRLGAGAAGAVYRGELRGGTEVAVKVLADDGSLVGFEEEVRVLSRFRHPNLVTLLGWGRGDGEKYLIYELLPGGDVGNRLDKCRRDKGQFFAQHRLRVALDAARGLSHMMISEPKAFHRDIKPANILLDAAGNAKMADFGLAGTIQESGRQHLTVKDISGTPGYACPAYIQSGRVNESSEVYSFGTVLLELIINQQPALLGPQGDIIYPLLQAVQPAAPGAHQRVLQSADPRAGWQRPVLDEFAELALSMVDMRPERRPNFETVVRRLSSLCNSGNGDGSTPPSMPPSLYQQQPQPQHQIAQPQQCAPMPPQGRATPPAPGYPQQQPQPQQPYAGYQQQQPQLQQHGQQQQHHHQHYQAHQATVGQESNTAGAPPPPPRPPPPRGGQEAAWGGAGERSRRHGAAQSSPTDPCELILDVVHADGVDLSSIPHAQRALGFPVDFTGGRWTATVGRQHQPDFFEILVPSRDRLSCISRSHFEISWEPAAPTPVLRKLSGNALLLDDKKLGYDGVTFSEGGRVSFNGVRESDTGFLIMTLSIRGRGAVRAEGSHPAVAMSSRRQAGQPSLGPPHGVPTPQRPAVAAAGVLECITAAGMDLAKLAEPAKVVALPLNEAVEIGRQHQLGFYEQLLQNEPRWLGFISRTHCSVQLIRKPAAPTAGGCHQLRVENLSSNPVLLGGRPLAKGQVDVITEGNTLCFVAATGGGPGGETVFLELRFRRARGSLC